MTSTKASASFSTAFSGRCCCACLWRNVTHCRLDTAVQADDYRARFASNVQRLRRDAGLSQEALADRAGLHRTELSLLETQRREPRLRTIVDLARGLDVPAAVLLEGIE